MNCLLVYPPTTAEVPAKSTLLGLGYLASVLRNRGHKVEIRDLFLAPKFWFNQYPDVVCVSAMFTQYKDSTLMWINRLRENFPDIYVVAGGAYASTFPEELEDHVDCVVVGEGEEVICDVVEHRPKGIVKTERIQDLDKLPFPAYDLMMDDIKEMNYLSRNSPFLMRRPLAHMITSRGCPNACTFCAVKVAWGRRWIPRSAKNVVDEIEYLYKLGFREIHFNDDNCSVNKERMYDICDFIIERGIDIRIACPTGIHVGSLERPLLRLMKKAGFYRLCFGIETGSPCMQKSIKKNLDLTKVKQVIKDANDLGFWTAGTFIMGFPDETETDRQLTINFAKESGLDFPIFYNLQIQPKTEMYDRFCTDLQGLHKIQDVSV